VKRGLTIKQNCVTVADVSLNDVANSKLICNLPSIRILQRDFYWAICGNILMNFDEICAWMYIGTVPYKFSQNFDIVSVGPFRECQDFSHESWHYDLIDSTVGIRRNYGSASEIDTLSRKILSKTTMFAFDPLTKRTDRFISE